MFKRSLLALAIAGTFATGTYAATPSNEEMWRIIQSQQREIEALKQQLQATDKRVQTTDAQVQATNQKVEATAEQVQATAEVVEKSGGEKLAKASQWINNTSIGGYGEVHYNNLEDKTSSDSKNEIDLHRFVLLFSHRFSDRTRLYSELEVEHAIASSEDDGEIEVEQAYIEHDLNAAATQRVKAGVFLVPVGILNETHEPDTFYGVERNNVERNIIPSTWFEGGVGLSGELAAGWGYDAAVTSGLGLEVAENLPDSGWKVRDGRQEASEANADALAYTGRIKYTAIPGLELAATAQYQSDIYQDQLLVLGNRRSVNAWLYEAHAAYQSEHFGLRALYAQWDIDKDIELIKAGANRQKGWYVEPNWRFNPQWGVFARYSEWDNQAGGSLDMQYTQTDIGFNYWLEPNVVVKLDVQNQHAPEGEAELDGFNLGVGWSF